MDGISVEYPPRRRRNPDRLRDARAPVQGTRGCRFRWVGRSDPNGLAEFPEPDECALAGASVVELRPRELDGERSGRLDGDGVGRNDQRGDDREIQRVEIGEDGYYRRFPDGSSITTRPSPPTKGARGLPTGSSGGSKTRHSLSHGTRRMEYGSPKIQRRRYCHRRPRG